MAEEAPAPKAEEQPQKKRLPIKTIIVVAAMLLVEAAGVYALFSFMHGPDPAQGEDVKHAEEKEAQNALHEAMIVSDRFPNHHTGRVWIWEVEVQIKVRQKHLDLVNKALEERNAEIKTGVSQIIRLAHHNHLKEPNLDTLSRQLLDFLRTVFGTDSDGEPRVQAVLIPKCIGFPTDF